jgi:hypothetical protein
MGPTAAAIENHAAMSCFLPSACLFCTHIQLDRPGDGVACDAFDEIPDSIFMGEVLHLAPYPGDGGLLFQLDPEQAEAFHEVNQLRREMGLPAVPATTPA